MPPSASRIPWRKPIPGAREVRLEAGKNLTFATPTIRVKAGEAIRLTFINPDVVPHNWVLVKPGMLKTVGELANRLIADPDAVARNYVPKADDVLVYTDVVPPQGTHGDSLPRADGAGAISLPLHVSGALDGDERRDAGGVTTSNFTQPTQPNPNRLQVKITMTLHDHSRRSFIKATAALMGSSAFLDGAFQAQSKESRRAAPRLRRHLQLPARRRAADPGGPAARQRPRHPPLPGGPRHRGADARRRSRDGHQPELPGGERRRHPPVLRQRDRPGGPGQGGHGQRLRHRPGGRETEAAQHRPLRRRRPHLREPPPVRAVRAGGQLLRRLGRGAAGP